MTKWIAEKAVYAGIQFDSIEEMKFYRILMSIPGLQAEVHKRHEIMPKSAPWPAITWSPDFTVTTSKNQKIVIEYKGGWITSNDCEKRNLATLMRLFTARFPEAIVIVTGQKNLSKYLPCYKTITETLQFIRNH